jgi:hypothetical protein
VFASHALGESCDRIYDLLLDGAAVLAGERTTRLPFVGTRRDVRRRLKGVSYRDIADGHARMPAYPVSREVATRSVRRTASP